MSVNFKRSGSLKEIGEPLELPVTYEDSFILVLLEINKELSKEIEKYMQLSNELGYPLELYFKLKSGTEILDKSNNIWFLESITNHKSLNCYREKEVYNYIGIGKLETIYHNFKIKNYGKTWWLKGDEQNVG